MDAREVETAWANVTACWADDDAHRAFLDCLDDLDGLAEAGRHYKAALDVRPGDEVAARWRDEVVKRATALALAQMPRAKPPRQLPPGWRRALLLLMLAAGVAGAGWVLLRMSQAVTR